MMDGFLHGDQHTRMMMSELILAHINHFEIFMRRKVLDSHKLFFFINWVQEH